MHQAQSLGRLLVEYGYITEQERQTIGESSGQDSYAFAKSILALGVLKPKGLFEFLREHSRFESVEFLEQDDVFDLDDKAVFLRFEAVPLSLNNNVLRVAVADPYDRSTIQQIEFFCGYRVKPVLANIAAIRLALIGLDEKFELRPSPLLGLVSTFRSTKEEDAPTKIGFFERMKTKVEEPEEEAIAAEMTGESNVRAMDEDHGHSIESSQEEVSSGVDESLSTEHEQAPQEEPEIVLEELTGAEDLDDLFAKEDLKQAQSVEAVPDDVDLELDASIQNVDDILADQTQTSQDALEGFDESSEDYIESSVENSEESTEENLAADLANNLEDRDASFEDEFSKNSTESQSEEIQDPTYNPASEEHGMDASIDLEIQADLSTTPTIEHVEGAAAQLDAPAVFDDDVDFSDGLDDEESPEDLVLDHDSPESSSLDVPGSVAPVVPMVSVAKLNHVLLNINFASSLDEAISELKKFMDPFCTRALLLVIEAGQQKSLAAWQDGELTESAPHLSSEVMELILGGSGGQVTSISDSGFTQVLVLKAPSSNVVALAYGELSVDINKELEIVLKSLANRIRL